MHLAQIPLLLQEKMADEIIAGQQQVMLLDLEGQSLPEFPLQCGMFRPAREIVELPRIDTIIKKQPVRAVGFARNCMPDGAQRTPCFSAPPVRLVRSSVLENIAFLAPWLAGITKHGVKVTAVNRARVS